MKKDSSNAYTILTRLYVLYISTIDLIWPTISVFNMTSNIPYFCLMYEAKSSKKCENLGDICCYRLLYRVQFRYKM